LEILFSVSPEKAKEELLNKLSDYGLPLEVAQEIAEKLSRGKKTLIKMLIEESEENEIRSALYTGLAYLLGVFFPVVPYFFAGSSLTALPFSILFAGSVLAIVATIVSILSGISIRQKVFEMVTTGLGAAFLSYMFGRLMESFFGASFGL